MWFYRRNNYGWSSRDVPPTKNYWKYIRSVCNKYNIHLLIDEVYCGMGITGKVYCIDYDKISPDFIFVGKTLAAGYAPLSMVLTSNKIINNLKKEMVELHIQLHIKAILLELLQHLPFKK